MKRIAAVILCCFALLLAAACGGKDKGYAEDGYAEGKLKETMHTRWFDFSVESAWLADDYGAFGAQEGKCLLCAKVRVKNTFNQNITMFDSDFQAQWGLAEEDETAFSVPVTYYEPEKETEEEQLPGAYELEPGKERSGVLVFEVPRGYSDFSLSYLENADNNQEGDLFFVMFSAKER